MSTPTLVATPGSASANTYATLVEADAYHDTRLSNSDWTGASEDTKNTALLMGTRLLDNMYDWSGTTVDDTQVLAWPRSGMIDELDRDFIDDTVIPQALKDALAELAFQLIIEDRTLDNDIESQKITSLTAGPVGLSFGEGVTAKVIPDAVFYLIPNWWGRARGRRQAVRDLLRG